MADTSSIYPSPNRPSQQGQGLNGEHDGPQNAPNMEAGRDAAGSLEPDEWIVEHQPGGGVVSGNAQGMALFHRLRDQSDRADGSRNR